MTDTRSSGGDFFNEFKRRHIFRAAAVYGAVAFVTLQVVDFAFPVLNIPDWVTRAMVVGAIAGFPFVIVFAWVYERAVPRVIARTSPARAAPASEVASSSVLTVVPFAVRGSEELAYLSEGIVDLLSSKLRIPGELRCVDPYAVIAWASREGGLALDPGKGRLIADKFGASLFILGNILEAGGRLHIEATLYEVEAPPRVVTQATSEGAAAELFDLIDDIARQLLTALTSGPAARLARLAVTTTGSFPALKSYLEGESEMRAMRRAPAAEAFMRAVEQDPSFALAWYRLGVAALWSGQLELARDAAERAVELSDRLTEHDRRLVQAFKALLRGEADDAERLYRIIVGNHPDDVEAWYQLGEVLFHYRPRSGGSICESRSAWERVLELEPEHVSALVHMAVIAACDGDREEVNEMVERVLEVSPEGDAVIWMLGLRGWELGDRKARTDVVRRLRSASDFAVARGAWLLALPSRDLTGASVFARLLTEPSRAPDVRALGHVCLAHLELAQGRWAEARAEMDEAESVHRGSMIHHRTVLWLAPFLDRPQQELEALRASLSEWDAESAPFSMTAGPYCTVHNGLHPQLRTYLLGILAARLGDEGVALRHAEELEREGGRPETRELARYQARSIRAHIYSSAGRVEDALAALECSRVGSLFELSIASPFFSQAYERYVLAGLFSSLGRYDEALCWYGSFAEHSIYDLMYLAPSHLRRAEIYERLEQPVEAASHYKRFVELWSESDRELRPMVERADERIIAL